MMRRGKTQKENYEKNAHKTVNVGIAYGIIITFLLLIAVAIQADDLNSSFAINQVPLTGYNELAKVLSKPDVRAEDKALAIKRLAYLTRDLKSQNKIKAAHLYNPILGVLSNPNNKKLEILRKDACYSLIAFSILDGSDKLIVPLGNIVKDKTDFMEVRKAAALALGRFYNDSAKATEQLVEALDMELKTGPKGNNISFTRQIVKSLGQLRNKKSFVYLMRVIRSDFPVSIKRSAQKALENLRWD